MLDLTAVLAAAAAIEQETIKAGKPAGETPCFLPQTQYPCGLAGSFSEAGNRETIFYERVWMEQGEMTNLPGTQTQSPPPLNQELNSAASQTPSITVSLVSFMSANPSQQGLALDFQGKHDCFQVYPVLPATLPDDYAQQERAAIMEYDGGMTREEAEAAAGLGERYFCAFVPGGNPNPDVFLVCSHGA